MRLFTAVSLPGELRETLVLSTAGLRGRYPKLRWLGQDAFHITLNFFGEVEETFLPLIETAMSMAAREVETFDMLLRGLGFFPGRSAARVLYLEVKRGADSCRLLQKTIVRQTGGLIPQDRRAYTPHLTLARVKGPSVLPDPAREGLNVETAFWVGHIDLYRSRLKSSGAEYELLSSVPLGK